MTQKNKFYITTTLPYVNAAPHIGFALEIIQADMIARYRRLIGDEVFFNFGTDEHGQKIYEKALEEHKDTQTYADEYAKKFVRFKNELNISYTNFIRTTDAHHIHAAQEFWRRCDASGDIYKKEYRVKYCVGCELEKTDSELENNHCPLHLKNDLEIRQEENYFFRFSRYQETLLELYMQYPDFVFPEVKLNEIRAFVSRGLQDFSVSRLKEKMPWGVDVPGDESHVMYVWFDALVNYVSAIGWPDNEKEFQSWWLDTQKKPHAIQIAGKDNLRQQSAMWQAMLFSAGLPTSRQILIHGFLTFAGQKISKSQGNTIDPFGVAKEYGTDALRYFLLREIPSSEDGDFSFSRLEERYNADLVNGLGNLTSRIISMIEKYLDGRITESQSSQKNAETDDIKNFEKMISEIYTNFIKNIETFHLDRAVEEAWRLVSLCDGFIDEKKPWRLAKEGKNDELSVVLYVLAENLRHIGILVLPIMPQTGEKILDILGYDWKGKILEDMRPWGLLEEGTQIKKPQMLFPRRQTKYSSF